MKLTEVKPNKGLLFKCQYVFEPTMVIVLEEMVMVIFLEEMVKMIFLEEIMIYLGKVQLLGLQLNVGKEITKALLKHQI